MAEAATLFDKALSNFNTARILRRFMGDDEEQLNIIAFHLQQALEFSIRYMLEMEGTEYPKTHNIEQLIRIGIKAGADLRLPEYITDHSEMFSVWEERSRYILGYLAEAEKIDRALKEVDAFLQSFHNDALPEECI